MPLENVMEPQMITDETRINKRLPIDYEHSFQMALNFYVTLNFICVNPCASVAYKGY